MKKGLVMIALAAIVSFLVGCGNSFQPRFYSISAPTVYVVQGDHKVPESTELSANLMEEFEAFYEELCVFYGIQKEIPRVRQVTREQFNDFAGEASEMDGCYDSYSKTVYILDSVESIQRMRQLLAHELLHYLSDNGNKRGFCYAIITNNRKTEFNRHFNEGATDYLACRFAGKIYESPYDYQHVLAEQVSIILGEEQFEAAYFNSDDTAIRNLFNENISDIYKGTEFDGIVFDSWDEFACNCYTIWGLGMINQVLDQANLFSCLEEEIIYLATKTGNDEEVKQVLTNFVKEYEKAGVNSNLLEQIYNYKYLISNFASF